MLSYNELPEKCSHLNSALLVLWKIKEAMLMHILVEEPWFFFYKKIFKYLANRLNSGIRHLIIWVRYGTQDRLLGNYDSIHTVWSVNDRAAGCPDFLLIWLNKYTYYCIYKSSIDSPHGTLYFQSQNSFFLLHFMLRDGGSRAARILAD